MKRAKPTKPNTQGLSLPGVVGDQVTELSTALKAYTGLERLVSPVTKDEVQARAPTSRSELGKMLRSLNTEMLRQADALAETAAALQAADELRRSAGGAEGDGPPRLDPPPV